MTSRKTLARIVAWRIVIFAALAATLQAFVIFADYYFDDTKLADLMVQRETGLLVEGIRREQSGWRYRLPDDLARYDSTDPSYVTRIRTPTGEVIYSDCDVNCERHLLPLEVNPPDVWSRLIGSGKPIKVAGGKTFTVEGQRIFIEIAVLDDHDHVLWGVLEQEFEDHLAIPMSIMLLLLLGGTLLSIHFALRPVRQAAHLAESIDPLDPKQTIDVAGMPREIADFGAAINRTLSRVRSLMSSQRVFTTAVAHEIRTPLAMMQLELSYIDHPRARKIEGDINALTRFIAQITALGRLESVDRTTLQPIDIAEIARRVVIDIAPYVYDRKDRIAFDDRGAGTVQGHAPLLYDAIRNLVENAVKHTPAGTGIEVVAGPGLEVSVVDDAGLLRDGGGIEFSNSTDRLGIGLEIVRRIMALHRGELQKHVVPGKETAMRLVFGVRRVP
ncbi:sensor histidine kinase [Labrys monachus]|uniref:histidine kinase n=1 Tax=Labrys monachus TaxID=217067 RepID=A0ABU0FDE9_9HYPH|nr:HAMP domain-containing sensor histidine kinase [Labrys monachus]MDQ0392100.1 signal transduction histidine kinase [Labrys monachus]